MIDEEICYQAILARDPRFDGRFFTGVLTTGVYCRPICSSRTPKRANCRFFPLAAAARDAGFRPCKRCRPEGAPGVSVWQGTSETVARAVKIISQPGPSTPAEVASAVAIGERQLRRLFVEHLGTTPGAMIRSKRLAFAAKLLGETGIPVTQVAFASGFGSVRRFNEAMKDEYGLAPNQLRKATKEVKGPTDQLTLAYRPPLDWEQMCAFMGRRVSSGTESMEGGAYRRLVLTSSGVGCIEVTHHPGRHALVLVCDQIPHEHLMEVSERTRKMFDLDADMGSIEARLSEDPAMDSMIARRSGLRLPTTWDPFEAGVKAIIGQRISVRAAGTITDRLITRFGRTIEGWEHLGLNRGFPTADVLARANLDDIGLPRARRLAVNRLAEGFASGSIPSAPGMPLERLIGRLMNIDGVGPWTANYIAMRGYGEPDAFLSTDLGVLKALESQGIAKSTRRSTSRTDAWRPWRSYAVMHLWAQLT